MEAWLQKTAPDALRWGFAARPYIPQSGIDYLESWFLSLQTELCIPQADTEMGGCGRHSAEYIKDACEWVTAPASSGVARLGAAGREKGWKLAKSSAI